MCFLERHPFLKDSLEIVLSVVKDQINLSTTAVSDLTDTESLVLRPVTCDNLNQVDDVLVL